MTNTSFNKISELMMPDRAAESRGAKTAVPDQVSSELAGQRFDQLLRTAGNDKPRDLMHQEVRRPKHRPKDAANRRRPAAPDRFDKPSTVDRPPKGNRSPKERASSSDRDRDDRVRSTDDKSSATDEVNHADEAPTKEVEPTTSEDKATRDTAEDAAAGASDEVTTVDLTVSGESVEGASPDESVEAAPESIVVSDAVARTGVSEELVEPVDVDAIDAASAEIDVDVDIEEATGDDEASVGNAEVESETAAANNAAAQVIATTTVADLGSAELAVEEDADIEIESSDQAQAATDSAVEEGPGTVAQTVAGEAGEADRAEVTDGNEGIDDGELADESNLDSEPQAESQDQQQTDAADSGETPLAAAAPVANVQATAQSGATTNAIGGLTEVAGTGEVGTAAGTQVAGTAPAEEADGADQLWRQVRRAMGSIRNLPTGEQQLTIRLRPDDLGSVVVRINTGEAGTTVALVADSAVAASQLSQQRQQLIQELEDGGLSGVAVDVGTSGDDTQPGDGDEAELNQAGGTIGTAGSSDSSDGTVGAYSERRVARNSEGLIDVDL